jgi:hypothetical protein
MAEVTDSFQVKVTFRNPPPPPNTFLQYFISVIDTILFVYCYVPWKGELWKTGAKEAGAVAYVTFRAFSATR